MSDQVKEPSYLVGRWEGQPPTHQIRTIGSLFGFLGTCPHAQTMEAFSSQFRSTVWIALPCRQWTCRHCAQVKIRQLSVKTEKARPNRLLTLTVDPSLWENPRHAFDGTRRKVPELFRTLRQRFHPIEYLRVTELTKRGWPHYHLLVRSPYLPQPVVQKRWLELTGARIVDLRQVKDRLNTYTYLVKYLSKMHRIGWTERHVSYSKGFFPPDDKQRPTGLDLSDQQFIEAHPSTYLMSRFRGATLTQLGINLFCIDPSGAATEDLAAPDPWVASPAGDGEVPSSPPEPDGEPRQQPRLFDKGSPSFYS